MRITNPFNQISHRARSRISLLPLTAICLLTSTLIAADPHARDWKQFPAIVELDTTQNIYAIGDIHGDYDTLVDLLAGAQIIPKIPKDPQDIQWSAGKSILVCTGDLIDRFDQSLQVIAAVRTLQTQAAKADGRVIITLGNHEAVFLEFAGKDKINEEFAAELKSAKISPKDLAAGHDAEGIGQFLLNLPAGARINDWFFCHAGNTHALTIKQLTDQIQTGVDTKGFAAPILSDPDSILQARMHPRPWWEAADSPALKTLKPHDPAQVAATEKHLRDAVTALGVNHLVFGHQPGEVTFADKSHRQPDQMFTKFDGLIFMIDTGMSRGVDNGPPAILKIQQTPNANTAYLITASGKSQLLWSPKDNPQN